MNRDFQIQILKSSNKFYNKFNFRFSENLKKFNRLRKAIKKNN